MAVFTALTGALVTAGMSTFWASMTVGAIQVAAGIGISLIGKALAGEPDKAKFGTQINLQGGDDVPRSIIFGYACTAGSLVYGNAWGEASGVPNAYFTQVIALADYPINEIVQIFVDDSPVSLLTPADDDKGSPVSEYRKDGVDHLWVKFYDGNQTSADDFLTDIVSSVDRPYEDTRIGYGIPYVIITAMAPERKDGEENPLFSGGFPSFKFAVNGAKLYDISKDSTEGGDGSHRWNDKTTWGGDGDFLPAVQLYNILRGITFNSSWLYGLQNLPKARLPSSSWISAIEKCRTEIEGPEGLEPTYRTGGEIQVGAQIKYALESLLTGCQGILTEIGGIYKPQIGTPDTSVKSFTDDDILSTEQQSFTPFFGLEDTINGIQAKYPFPDEAWNVKTAPPLLNSEYEERDGNRRLLADVTLDMVPYTGQVQRLMKASLSAAQRARRHTLTLGPEYWALEPGDIITWTSARNGYISKEFKVDGVADQPNLDILIDITEVDPSDYDWDQDTDFRPVDPAPIDIIDPVPLDMYDFNVTAVAIKDENGEDRRPGIKITYASGLQSISSVKYQVRIDGDINPYLSGEVPYGSPWETIISADFSANTAYQVRAIYVRVNGEPANWSDWENVTTLDIKLTGNDIIVDTSAFPDDLTGVEILDTLPSTGNFEGRIVFLTTDSKLYRHTGSPSDETGFTTLVPAADISGEISTVQIADDAIVAVKIADDAIVESKIADSQITASKIASDASLTEIVTSLPSTGNYEGRIVFLTTDNKLYRHIGSPSDATGFTTAVPAVDISGTLTDSQIADLSAAKITGQITGTQITDNAITTPKIFAGAITTAKIAASAITANEIATDAITTGKIQAGAITTAKIAASAITANEIATNAVTAVKILAGTITGDKIAVNTISASKMIITGDMGSVNTDPNMTDSTFWNLTNIAITSVSDAFVGSTVLRLTNTVASYYDNKRFPIDATKDYLLEFVIRQTSGSGVFYGVSHFFNTSGTLIAYTGGLGWPGGSSNNYYYPGGVNPPNGPGWTRYVMTLGPNGTFKFPSGTAFMALGFLGNYPSATAVQDVGLIKLTEMARGELVVDGQITTTKLAAGSITTAKLAAGAVTANEIATNAVTSIKINAGAITTAKIDAGAVTANEIATNAVTSIKINAGAITTAKLAAGAVTANEIATDAVTANKILAGAIVAGKISAAAIDVANLFVDGVIITDKIAAEAVTKASYSKQTGSDVFINTSHGGATTGDFYPPTNAPIEVWSDTYTPNDGRVVIQFSALAYCDSPDGPTFWYLYKDGVLIDGIIGNYAFDSTAGFGYDRVKSFLTSALFEDPSPGTTAHTYSLRACRGIGGSASFYAWQTQMYISNYKK